MDFPRLDNVNETALIIVVAILAFGVAKILEELGRTKYKRRRNRNFSSPSTRFTPETSKSPDHLQLVAEAAFKRVPLLNKSEARLLPILEKLVRELGQGHRLLIQVALGELLCAANADGKPNYGLEANRAINAKRLDFAIIDRRGLMVAAIEYQGSGHHLSSNAFMRDAVKREALRKAGISLIELPPDADEALIRDRLSSVADLPLATSLLREPPLSREN